jgi:hypothetical protein
MAKRKGLLKQRRKGISGPKRGPGKFRYTKSCMSGGR